MDAEQIVKTLKWLAECTEFAFAGEALDAAADLIESLQAQLAAKDAEIARLVAEKAAAVSALAFGDDCRGCKYAVDDQSCECSECGNDDTPCDGCPWINDPCSNCERNGGEENNWEWRGAEEG